MANDAGTARERPTISYNRLLIFVAGLGGLLYGIDVGIIAGALPYLEATSGLDAGRLSVIVAAVLLGSVFGTLAAGVLSDRMGRKNVMAWSGALFVASIPVIALSHGFGPLFAGRLLQGASAGLIGVVVPLYLAECLSASSRGKGTGIFQWMLVMGLVAASAIGMYFSYRVDVVSKLGDAAKLFAFKDIAWRSIFWVSLPPGILFVIGSFMVAESPRWLYRRGRIDDARRALARSRSAGQTDIELKEMEAALIAEKAASAGRKAADSLLKRKYVIPFLLACVILACNQATGINSIIGFNTTILIQGGLSDVAAHWGSLLFTIVNFLFTIVAVVLVDRKGRKFLLTLGTAGVIVSLVGAGILFGRIENQRADCRDAVQAMVAKDQTLSLTYNDSVVSALLPAPAAAGRTARAAPTSMILIYSYGDFKAASRAARTGVPDEKPLDISRGATLPANKVIAFFSNPFGNLDKARGAPLKIENALITPVPSAGNGWAVALFLYLFMAFFAIGPGVCVWLALSELMPTRIRSSGMSIALLINQAVSTAIAAFFLPMVGKHGYSAMFFTFAGCTVVYFVTAAFFLPETKGKTLEEVEKFFGAKK